MIEKLRLGSKKLRSFRLVSSGMGQSTSAMEPTIAPNMVVSCYYSVHILSQASFV
ncbi:MAG: hypothetical protein PUI10_06860 [Prevotellaceae bacterium]|nr:hypothetical protein [Prevotellaceae bacterium]